MKETSVRSLTTQIVGYGARIKALQFLLLILLCFVGNRGYSAVVITQGNGGANICSSKAVGGIAPAYTTLSNIVITEGLISDLSGPGTDVLVLNAPTGWQFNTGTPPTITYITGSNITSTPVFTITATSITINISTNGTNGSDQFSINGLQVQATSTSAAAGYIYPSSAVGIAGITTGSSGTDFGNLSLTNPVTPAVTIAASPSGSVCPGINVVFSPTPVNGGTVPTYQWYLNGASIVTGATYSNNTLATGNTVYCVMTASGSCVTATTATSNTITMSLLPGPLPVTGPMVTCPGTTISLSDNTTGGVWSSSNTAIATTDASGNVTGVSVGTAIISYTSGTCASTANITVNYQPVTPILSTTVATMCSGDVAAITATGTPLTSTILSQNFNSGLAPWTVDNTGSVGTYTATPWRVCGDGYTNEQGTYHSPDNSAFVMSNPDTSISSTINSTKLISPVFSLAGYIGATLTFQQAYEYWPPGDTSVSVQISTDGGTTWSTLQNYVGSNVGNRGGFVQETFSLNDYLGQTNLRLRFYYYGHWGYYWAIDNILIAGTSAIIIPIWSPSTYLYTDAAYTTPYTTGAALNTVYVHPSSISISGAITYTATAVSTGCSVASSSTINFTPTPSAITGTGNVCIGNTINLSDAITGGTWSSGSTSIATVVPGSGVVTGMAAGTANITYQLGTGCYTTTVITVNSLPATISGTKGVCIGGTTSLSDATTAGTWLSSNTATATIGSTTGFVTSVATGTTNITYTIGTGCNAIVVVTVNPLPASINGNTSVCVGSFTSLSDANSGGTWSSGAPGIAIAGSGSGYVVGMSAGSATITYTLGTGCMITTQVTVNPVLPITGTAIVCEGSSTTLSNGISGGTWTSNNTSIATAIPGTGAITGVAGGTAIISYTLPTGCTSTVVFTVNPLPASITGTMQVCVGSNTSLTDIINGGVWSSALSSIATVGSSSGIVRGISPGSTSIKYTLSTGCFITATVTVNPLPQAISGITTVCAGSSTILSDLTGGGSWLSNDATIASIGTSGMATGVAAGSTTITYSLPTGCFAVTNFTVNPLPIAINGNTVVCVGLTTRLSDGLSGGTWTSSDPSVATIGSANGIVTGIGQGAATITYTLATGCLATTTITANPIPGTINGNPAICNGFTTTLSNSTTGGTWTSGSVSVATIGSATGVVTGLSSGTSMITYSLSTGCIATKIITVNPLPGSINGVAIVCQGSATPLSDASTGGVWSNDNISVATIGTSSGIVAGISPGTTNITYSLGTGCTTVTVVTVSGLPAAISGSNTVCFSSVTGLSDATGGGTWSSSNTTNAIIGSLTGSVTGIGTGTATISYTIPVGSGVGCSIATTITVNPLPSGITGAASVCTGATINLTDGSTGGTWSSSDVSKATINSSGVLTGVTVGGIMITYTLSTGCTATKPVNVNQTPAAISGATGVCQGAAISLSDANSGGTWTCSNIFLATVGSATGIVSGISVGTVNITYTLSGGCYASSLVTVNLSPTNINGALTICAGSTTNLSNATTGGTWASSNTAIASVISFSGSVNGVAAGTATITYTLGDGCVTDTVVTVNVMPTSVNGIANVCVGLTTNLSDNVIGGTWTSSNTSIAVVGSLTGIVNGLSAGTAIITYGFATGCIVTTVVTVNVTPGSIIGTTSICLGYATNLTDFTVGGVWTSSNTVVATVGTGSGLVTSASAGIAAIFYTLPTGCAASRTVVVYPLPSMIDGTTNICAGTVTILTDSVYGGTWSSGNNTIATVGTSTGALTGIGSGTVTVSYSFGAGCTATTIVTVNLLPSSISGNSVVCVGSTTTLSDPIGGGGFWSSSDLSIAQIGSVTGIVSGINAGTATITYSLGVGCTLATIVTVNPLPATIVEAASLCFGSSTILSDAATGGTWSCSNTGIATIGSLTGVISAVTTGTVMVTYMLGTGCQTAAVVTVYPLPVPISGIAPVCVGSITNLHDATPGGTWVSGAPGIAVAGIGTASGVSAGTATISYILNTGCFVSTVITVNPLPSPISGSSNVCAGLATTLTDGTSGGTWSSSNLPVATVGSVFGIVSGITNGTSNITYTLPTGCISTTTFTVLSLPLAINGSNNVCQGLTINLSDATTGGSWSSNDLSIAYIDASTGNLTGVAAGSTTVTYTVGGTGCIAVAGITVNPLPSEINGAISICSGSSTSLSNTSTPGGWSSSNSLIASIDPFSGLMTGVSTGTATITYTIATGCIQTAVATINPLPSLITGTESVCAGFGTSLTDISTGGTWSNGGPSGILLVAPSTGLITSISAGTATITYTLPTGCITTAIVTVNPLPSAITGSQQVCAGFGTSLTDASPGGTWTSAAISVATVGPGTGIVSGISWGVTVITYTLPTGCIATMGVSVNPLPATITGVGNVCAGLSATLTDISPGGVWNIAGSAGIATIDSATGIVTGISAGTVVITYTVSTGCFIATSFTVNPLPLAINGIANVCVGLTTTLTDAAAGGSWSSSNSSVGGINAATGVVAGNTAGTAIITYTLPTGCIITTTITVNPLPAPITGLENVCVGLTVNLSDVIAAGIWNSGSPAIANIGTVSGIVTGLAAGTANITYTLSTGCIASTTITVNPLPMAITGTMNVCTGLTVSLSDATSGGTWASSTTGVSNINASGIANGVSAGTSVITYQLPTGCLVTRVLTVNPLPSAITGITAICTGNATTLSDITSGGNWSITGSTVASIGSTTGIVTGLSAGTTIVTYKLPTGCLNTITETVFSSPLAITGSGAVCSGSTINLTDATLSGTWLSSNSAIASVGPATGFVTGIAAGTAMITYALGSGCFSVATVTVNPLPTPISGLTAICTGHTALLSDGVASGTWSLNPGSSGIATIGSSSGLITALSSGTAVVSYILSTGCYVITAITVNPSPASITGTTHVCAGSGTLLSDITTSGAWSSGNTVIATVSSGAVTGVSAGTAIISYALSSGCYAVAAYTVNPLPSVIAGNRSVCIGSTSAFSDALTGGIWNITGSAGVASIGSASGVVSGISLGTAVITYTLPTGCFANAPITVNPYPAIINGPISVCQGSFIYLSDATIGGAWGSSNTAIAIVNPSSGAVTGISGGSVIISYTLPTGCYLVHNMTVNPVAPITGSTNLCAGSTYVFSDLTPGGTWSSNSSTVATIISGAGVATAIASGTTIISYALSTGCNTSIAITVNPIPASFYVIGGGNYCFGGPGVFIGLNGSDIGITYQLYKDTSFITAKPGTDSAIYYGPYTSPGTYTIIAVNNITGCSNAMAGIDTIGITPILPPSVSITSSTGDTVCAGVSTTFIALPVNGGTSPAYHWYVNGAAITGATNSTYSYIPVAGNIVSVKLTSNAACILPDTASNSFVVITTPNLSSSVNITVTPGDTICAHVPVTIIPAPVNGGSSPSYRWVKNGLTADTGSTYNYTPVNGDNVFCVLYSNYRCLVDDSVNSNNVHFTVVPLLTPTVTITAHPGLSVISGQNDTLIAIVTNAGVAIAYQWKINSIAIPGATSDTFIYSNFTNDDTVVCIVNSSNNCGGIPASAELIMNVINVGIQQVVTSGWDIKLLPNPNNGNFIIKGSIGNNIDDEISMEITDMLGQMVYQKNIKINHGNINENIYSPSSIPNGVYLIHMFQHSPLNLSTINWVSHFVIAK